MKTPAFLFVLICSVSVDAAPSDGSGPVDQHVKEDDVTLSWLKSQVKCLTEKVEEHFLLLKAHQTNLEEQSAKLKKQEIELQAPKVAFSASIVDKGGADLGPYNALTPLVFGNAFTNVGNAYNSTTGIFTVPVKGVYHFETHVIGQGGTPTAAWLMKNGQKVYCVYVFMTTPHWQKASNGVSLILDVGDQMHVNLDPNAKIHDSYYHHSIFSGQLLFTL